LAMRGEPLVKEIAPAAFGQPDSDRG
jgi:hypothetical protein